MIFNLFLLSAETLKIKLSKTSPMKFNSFITVYRYDIFKGLDKKEFSETELKKDGEIFIFSEKIEYPFFQKVYVKTNEGIYVSDFLYNNLQFKHENRAMLKLLVKIGILVKRNESNLNTRLGNKSKLRKLVHKDLHQIRSFEDIHTYMITDFMKYFNFTETTRSEYLKHVKACLWFFYALIEDCSIEDNLCDELDAARETDLFKLSDELNDKLIMTNEAFPDELIIPEKQLKLIKFIN